MANKSNNTEVINLKINGLEDDIRVIKKEVKKNGDKVIHIEIEQVGFQKDLETLKKIVYGVVGIALVFLINNILNLI